jgi:xylulokinase
MSLLGIDVGTTGCKAAVFSEEGKMLATAYEEYAIESPQAGWAQLDARHVWGLVKSIIRRVTVDAAKDPVCALCVSSMGEATVPVSRNRQILGPSILNFDARGEEYLPALRSVYSDERFYQITGNTPGNHFGLTKMMWTRDHDANVYDAAWKFIPWSGFISFMLGAEPSVDYSLANRCMCFDLAAGRWSREILDKARIDVEKLPTPHPTGTSVGEVSSEIAVDLGLNKGIPITIGCHDQCANAVGCGVIGEGPAMYGMGTYICITPIFTGRPDAKIMIPRGLNTEHHAVPGKMVSFIYNQGGALVKWFRDTFAVVDHRVARAEGRDVYDALMRELPADPTGLMVLPHFMATGSPHFISDSCGIIAGLKTDTSRGTILKGIMEGFTYYFREAIEDLPATGIEITEYRAAGGGCKSDTWLQMSADIMGAPFTRLQCTEAGILGAAIIAGVGCGVFASHDEGVKRMVECAQTFEPNALQHERYGNMFEQYRKIWPAMSEFLKQTAALTKHAQ